MPENQSNQNESEHSSVSQKPLPAKISKGLIAVGLVSIVGSWTGMAVYMNHRLSDVADEFKRDRQVIV